jgi:magnesium transporter
MNCAATNLQAADVSLDWMGACLDSLRAALQMHQQDQTNRRLGMLTVLSAIFMPITLMAGIWGMNFETMPELSLRFGYPLALALMVAVAVGMFRYFRKHGWFG